MGWERSWVRPLTQQEQHGRQEQRAQGPGCLAARRERRARLKQARLARHCVRVQACVYRYMGRRAAQGARLWSARVRAGAASASCGSDDRRTACPARAPRLMLRNILRAGSRSKLMLRQPAQVPRSDRWISKRRAAKDMLCTAAIERVNVEGRHKRSGFRVTAVFVSDISSLVWASSLYQPAPSICGSSSAARLRHRRSYRLRLLGAGTTQSTEESGGGAESDGGAAA